MAGQAGAGAVSWVAGLGLFLLGMGCEAVLQSGLEEQEANAVLVALARSGIAGDKQAGGGRDGFRVEVDPDELAAAWQALQSAGLPRPRHEGFRETFRERGLVPGATEEQALFLGALQEELARTLEALDGVCAARVHVVAPRDDGGLRHVGAPLAAPSAAVLLTLSGGGPPIAEDEVRALVAHAVAGLEPSRVAVVLAPRRASADTASALPPRGTPWRALAAGVGALALLSLGVRLGVRWFCGARAARRSAEAG